MSQPSTLEMARHAPGSPRSRRHVGGPMRPPPRAFARSHLNKGADAEDHNRAILTISEDSTIEYVNEEDDEINRLLREKGEKLDAAVAPPRAGAGDNGSIHDDTASGRGSPKGHGTECDMDLIAGGTKTSEATTSAKPSAVIDGDVDLFLVASKLQALLGVADESEITPSCALGSMGTSDDDAPPARFYASEHGNDALAAGMFDISVVQHELAAPHTHAHGKESTTTTDHDVSAVCSGDAAGIKAPPTVGTHPKLPRAVELLRTDDSYRPRTSSKALEPSVALLTGGDDSYRPRTSSRALEPQWDTPPDTPHAPQQGSRLTSHAAGEAGRAVPLTTDSGSYRPRTSSKAIEPEITE